MKEWKGWKEDKAQLTQKNYFRRLYLVFGTLSLKVQYYWFYLFFLLSGVVLETDPRKKNCPKEKEESTVSPKWLEVAETRGLTRCQNLGEYSELWKCMCSEAHADEEPLSASSSHPASTSGHSHGWPPTLCLWCIPISPVQMRREFRKEFGRQGNGSL